MPMPCGEIDRGPISMRETISHASGSMPNLKTSAITTAGSLDLSVLGRPRAVLDNEVAEQQRSLLLHDLADLVEHEAQFLLGSRIGAHLDHVPQRADVGGPDNHRRDAIRREPTHRRG